MPLHEEINAYLMSLLQQKRARAPVTYNQLADALGQPRVTDAWRSHPFCEAFGILDQEDALKKRPFRTSLIFSNASNMPGEGYFSALQTMKGMVIPRDERKRQTIYLKELGEAMSYYAQNPVSYEA